MTQGVIREDWQQIIDWVPSGARLLDVGCDEGGLMRLLRDQKQVDAQGLELDSTKALQAISAGLSVIQGDANTDLPDYPTGLFDVVVLSQTLQTLHRPRETLRELGRIAPKVIVSTPNFAYWRGVMQLLFRGRMPMTRSLPVMWYDTPNIHLCTITDFLELTKLEGFTVQEGVCFDAQHRPKPWPVDSISARLFSIQGLFLLEKQ